jgi:hypothetical protein
MAEKDAKHARTRAALDGSRKMLKNLLRFGVPAVVILLVLVFFATKQHYNRSSAANGFNEHLPLF